MLLYTTVHVAHVTLMPVQFGLMRKYTMRLWACLSVCGLLVKLQALFPPLQCVMVLKPWEESFTSFLLCCRA